MELIKGGFKNAFKKLLSIEDTPYRIAAGAALGVFFGILPGGITVALAVALLLRLNKKSVAVCVLVTNTWSTVALLPAFAWVGSRLFEKNYLDVDFFYREITTHGLMYLFSNVIIRDIAVPLLVGMVVVAFLLAIVIFVLLFTILQYYKRALTK